MVRNHRFLVLRKKSSHQYKSDPTAPDSWTGNQNCHNNRNDTILLFDGDKELWRCETYQTVANIPGGRYLDTIAQGDFFLQWDVDPRLHRGHVHGIILALDIEGQFIDSRSIEPIPGQDGAPLDFNRWLWHDDQKLTTSPNERCRAAWSAGCFITGKPESDALYALGVDLGFSKGDTIPATLREVEG